MPNSQSDPWLANLNERSETFALLHLSTAVPIPMQEFKWNESRNNPPSIGT